MRTVAVPAAQRGLFRLQSHPTPNTNRWNRFSSMTELSPSPPITIPFVTTARDSSRALVASHSITEGIYILTETFTDPKSIVEFPTRMSLRKEDGVHLLPKSVIKYTNHSFDPNARIVFAMSDDDDDTAVSYHRVILESLKVIQPREEITIDYSQTERVMAEPFVDHKTGRKVGYDQ